MRMQINYLMLRGIKKQYSGTKGLLSKDMRVLKHIWRYVIFMVLV